MKPRELYSGPAPAAQAQMGAGILEAGANIGRSIQSGYESLGKSLGAGLQAVGGAVGQYETAKSANKVTESLLGNEELSKTILGVSGQQRVDMLSSFRDTIAQHGQMGGAQFSSQLLTPIHEYAQIGRQYTQQQELAKTAADASKYNAEIGAEAHRFVGALPYGMPKGGAGVSASSFFPPATAPAVVLGPEPYTNVPASQVKAFKNDPMNAGVPLTVEGLAAWSADYLKKERERGVNRTPNFTIGIQ
jgi:hypothetical protein